MKEKQKSFSQLSRVITEANCFHHEIMKLYQMEYIELMERVNYI